MIACGRRWAWWLAGTAALTCVLAASGFGADETPAGPPGPGVRFTPGMARATAGIFTRELLKGRYGLPEDKIEDAQEKVARRLMQMAHKIDEPGSELVEQFVAEQLNRQAEGGGDSSMWAGLGKDFAGRVLPILPEIRDMVRGVSQDVRPMLPMKKQLKMAGDLMGLEMGINGFEEVMKKWSSGETTDYQNPFNSQPRAKKDESGETHNLKASRQKAQKAIDKPRAEGWAKYVASFKKLYNLDSGQAAAADSILREFSERENTLRSNPAWRDRIYQGQIWVEVSKQLPNSWMHPAKTLIEDNVARTRLSWNDLEEDFKARLETIVTSGQRRAAEEKVEALLKEKKLLLAETRP